MPRSMVERPRGSVRAPNEVRRAASSSFCSSLGPRISSLTTWSGSAATILSVAPAAAARHSTRTTVSPTSSFLSSSGVEPAGWPLMTTLRRRIREHEQLADRLEVGRMLSVCPGLTSTVAWKGLVASRVTMISACRGDRHVGRTLPTLAPSCRRGVGTGEMTLCAPRLASGLGRLEDGDEPAFTVTGSSGSCSRALTS